VNIRNGQLEEIPMTIAGQERAMDTRRIGSLDVSVVGLGCNNFGWKLDEAATAAVVHAALDAGIAFFDTADIYGDTRSEVFLGRALGKRREHVVIATKFGMAVDDQRRGARPEYVKQACEDSLRRLGTDRIDLYQLHQPDPSVPIQDTLGALNDLVRAGKVREIGCSNFSVEQLREAEAAVRPGAAPFVSVQNEYNLLHRDPERDVLPECRRLGMAFLPFFPLASGLLTGKYRQGQAPPEGSRLATVERFAKRRLIGRSPSSNRCSSLRRHDDIRWWNWPSHGWHRSRPSRRSSPGPPHRNKCGRTPPPQSGASQLTN
jgi:aryl-alcohol dehydrogenase-like predicted oxidoreductase